jgi:hypothetical protein
MSAKALLEDSAASVIHRREADVYMKQGLNLHGMFQGHWQKTKECMLRSGYFFLCAKQAVKDGDWEMYVETYLASNITRDGKPSLSSRTIRTHMAVTSAALEWAQKENPGVKKPEKLLEIAITAMMQSPREMVELFRSMRELRPFGEYDKVGYHSRKLLKNSGQIEFEFEKVLAPLEMLGRFGDENICFKFPEGKDEDQFISELETKLETALQRVREVKKNGRVTDV